MRALTVRPEQAHSAELRELPEPAPQEGSVLVQGEALGICGTDVEIVRGSYGWAPPGQDWLVLGHESLGRVLEAPKGSGLVEGDWVAGIVRRPDPVPCPACAADEWDMCRNGLYTEHGIKSLAGFGSERYRLDPRFTVKLDPQLGRLGVLLEPTSVVAKAWEQVERIGARGSWAPRRVLVTGAGPIGLLAALLGRQRKLEVHVLDRATEGLKPALVRDLGATYHSSALSELPREGWDLVIECTGAASLFFPLIQRLAPEGIMCLAGVSSPGKPVDVDPGALNRQLVLQNNVVFGSVNANRRHYEAAAQALTRADPAWLSRLITREVPLDRWKEALERRDGDVKTVLLLKH